MRTVMLATVAFSLMATPTLADSMKNCVEAYSGKPAAEKPTSGYRDYMKMCMANDYTVAASPAPTAVPAGATAICKDKTYTMIKTHAGACSTHGGVEHWL